MARRWKLATWLAVATMWPLALFGQEPDDPLDGTRNRTIAELVDSLSGTPVALQELVGIALERSLELAASGIRHRLAEADADVQGGIFDPSVNLRSSFVTSRSEAVSSARLVSADVGALTRWGSRFGLGLRGGQNQDVFFEPGSDFETDLFLSMSQPLLDGFRVADAPYRSATHEREAARLRASRAEEQLIAQITSLYWSLAEAEAVEAVLQRSYELAEALVLRNQQLEERRLIAAVDVITARSGVALRRAGLIQARRQRIDAAEALIFAAYGEGALARLQADTIPIKTSTPPPSAPADLDRPSAEGQALEKRRDVAAARAVLTAAIDLERGARNGIRPGLFLDGSWTTSTEPRTRGDQLGPLENPAWRVGLRFSMPVGNRTDRGRASRAAQTVALGRISVSAAENVAIQQLREATRAVRSGLERSVAGAEAAELAAAQLDAEEQRLALGLGDSFRLLETEENAVQAELESVRARYDLARATTRLLLARGEITGR